MLPRGLGLGLRLKTYMCTVCTILIFLLFIVVNIILQVLQICIVCGTLFTCLAMVLEEGGILIRCVISSSMLEVVGEVWKGILL